MQPELARTPPRMALTHAQTRSLTQVLTETYPRPAAFTELEVGLGAPVQLDPVLAPEDRALFLVTWAEEEDDRIHALLVRLAGAAPSTGAAVVLRIQQERHPDWAAPELIRWLAEALELPEEPSVGTESLAERVVALGRRHGDARILAAALVHEAVRRERRGVPAAAFWEEAWRVGHSASPGLDSGLADALRRGLFTTPWPLRRVRLEQVRVFEALDLTVPSPQAGQWTLLIGRNGAGKSALLRALALALVDDSTAAALLADLGRDSPTVRLHAGAARVEVTGGWSLPEVRLAAREDATDALEPRQDAPRPFVAAYGARRGSALGDRERGVDLNSLAAVRTLFDENAPLIHAETWLKLRCGAAAQAGPDSAAQQFLHALLELLAELLHEVDSVTVSVEEGVRLQGEGCGDIPLSAASDGYLTTLGWVVDLVARWCEEARRRGVPVAGNFATQMTGVVLVDELDLHLHPVWQYEVVEHLRARFPRLTFVVTTHNPLTLLGARPGEIHLLRHTGDEDAGGPVECLQVDIPSGTDVRAVLSGPWYDLQSTVDPGTARLLRERTRLLREAPGSPHLTAVTNELNRRLRQGHAPTALEDAAARVLADLAADLPRLTDEDRQAIQAEMRSAIAMLEADPRIGDSP